MGSPRVEVEAARVSSPVSSPVSSVALRPVLIADDDPASVALVELQLEELRLVNPRAVARDGAAAIAFLTWCLTEEAALPALVLLDGRMPLASGLEVLLWMRQQPRLAEVPVVLLTGDGAHESIRDAYAAGASSYLVKPVAYNALADVLRGLEMAWALA